MTPPSEVSHYRVSVVVTARNDDHGGGLLRRAQIFLDGFMEQARRHDFNGELILVEWNPPSDRPRLADALRWPREPGPCVARIIEVSPEIHRRFQHADRLGLFQMIAKNAGVRRARGQFALLTNIDLLFSDDLMRFLASEDLDPDCLYRTDRIDVDAGVPLGASVSEQLEYCRQHVLRVNSRWGTFAPSSVRTAEALREGAVWLAQRLRPRLHTNACGDFTLLSRQRFLALRGYPEFEMYSLHMDSILCAMAVAGGAKETILAGKMRLYHLEHGSGWVPGEAEKLVARLTAAGVPILDYPQYVVWANESRRRNSPILFNGEGWGLAADKLPEVDPMERARQTVRAVAAHARL